MRSLFNLSLIKRRFQDRFSFDFERFHFIVLQYFPLLAKFLSLQPWMQSLRRERLIWFPKVLFYWATPTSIMSQRTKRNTSIWLIECTLSQTRTQTIGILTTFFRLDNFHFNNRLMAWEFRSSQTSDDEEEASRLHVAMKGKENERGDESQVYTNIKATENSSGR